MSTNDTYSIISAIMAAGAAGLVGGFALMKRMALAGDVISHIALPGLGLALLYGINPLLGGAATLALGIILIWRLEKKTGLTTEVTIGVIFASSVALGALITPKEDLIEALFGGFENITFEGFIFAVVVSLVVVYMLWRLKSKLILALFSPELAEATRVNTNLLNFYFLLLFGLAIILGLRLLGAILVGSLIIIPAAAARQLTHTLGAFLTASAVISILSVIFGFVISTKYGITLGPTVVCVAALIFALSLFKSKK